MKAVSVVANVTYDGKKIGNLAGSIELVECPVDEGFFVVFCLFDIIAFVYFVLFFLDLECYVWIIITGAIILIIFVLIGLCLFVKKQLLSSHNDDSDVRNGNILIDFVYNILSEIKRQFLKLSILKKR